MLSLRRWSKQGVALFVHPHGTRRRKLKIPGFRANRIQRRRQIPAWPVVGHVHVAAISIHHRMVSDPGKIMLDTVGWKQQCVAYLESR